MKAAVEVDVEIKELKMGKTREVGVEVEKAGKSFF